MTTDIEPILQVLSNSLQQIPLTDDELELLRSWLMADIENERLFDEISHQDQWEREWPKDIPKTPEGNIERIRRRMIENLEKQE